MNTDPDFCGENGDKAFVHALVLRVFGRDIDHGDLSSAKMNFIKGRFSYYIYNKKQTTIIQIFILRQISLRVV